MTTTSKTTGASKTPEWDRYKNWCLKHEDYLKDGEFWKEEGNLEDIVEHMVYVYTRSFPGRVHAFVKELVLVRARQEEE